MGGGMKRLWGNQFTQFLCVSNAAFGELIRVWRGFMSEKCFFKRLHATSKRCKTIVANFFQTSFFFKVFNHLLTLQDVPLSQSASF